MSIDEPFFETFDFSNSFVKAALAFIVGIVILSGLVAGTYHPESVTFSFTENPQAGDTITINSQTYEFTSTGSVASGHIPVMIGATLSDSVNNFETALHANTNFQIS